MKNGKAQLSTAAAVILIVIVLILAAIAVTVIIVKPSLLLNVPDYDRTSYERQFQYRLQVSDYEDTNDDEDDFTCNPPYIQMGMNCCLDKDYNGICDSDEETEIDYGNRCDYPYKDIGSKCCIDENRNNICDSDEQYYDDEDEDDAYISSPFSVYDYDINSDEIVLWIKNKDDKTVTITRIEIEDCDDYNDETMLEEDERERFEFDCDRDSNFDRDILVTYTVEGSDEEETARGNVERNDYNYGYDY
ncbi:MAG: hypothetical protein RL557_26 [archaeon]|jgi:hypothetical protein